MAVVPASSHGVTLGSVTSVSGTAQSGYVLTATSATAADWEALPSSGALTLLSTTTRATDGTLDVSSISQAYNDLVLVVMAKGAESTNTTDTLLLRLNNDSTANYSTDVLRANGSSASGVQTLDATSAHMSESMATNAAASLANSFSAFRIEINGYTSTTWLKQIQGQAANAGKDLANFLVPEIASAVWLSTAAVNRITLFGGSTANLLTGSMVRIYGRL